MLRSRSKAAAPASRDPERTQRRILDAALHEFAARGFAGARVDAVARRAGTNKRMLYHYFQDKAGLFRAVLRKKMAQRQSLAFGSPEDFIASLPAWFGGRCKNATCRANCTPWCAAAWFAENSRDVDWIRVLAWEALHALDGRIVEEKQRRQSAARAIAGIRRDQAQGKINPAFAPEYLQLAMVSLAMFPVALPQIARLIVGRPPASPEFQREYADFLKQFLGAFRPSKRG